MDIHCVTTWSKLDTEWEGVSLKTLLDAGLVVDAENYLVTINQVTGLAG